MHAMTIAPSGAIEIHDTDGKYDWLHEKIGGWIEAVQLRPDVTMYVDEEHKLKSSEPNEQATRLAHHFGAIYSDDWIGGPTVVIGFNASDGESATLPHDFTLEAARCLLNPSTPPLVVPPTFWESVAESVYEGIPVIAAISPHALAPRCATCGGALMRRTNVGLAPDQDDPSQPWLHVSEDDWRDNPHDAVPAVESEAS